MSVSRSRRTHLGIRGQELTVGWNYQARSGDQEDRSTTPLGCERNSLLMRPFRWGCW